MILPHVSDNRVYAHFFSSNLTNAEFRKSFFFDLRDEAATLARAIERQCRAVRGSGQEEMTDTQSPSSTQIGAQTFRLRSRRSAFLAIGFAQQTFVANPARRRLYFPDYDDNTRNNHECCPGGTNPATNAKPTEPFLAHEFNSTYDIWSEKHNETLTEYREYLTNHVYDADYQEKRKTALRTKIKTQGNFKNNTNTNNNNGMRVDADKQLTDNDSGLTDAVGRAFNAEFDQLLADEINFLSCFLSFSVFDNRSIYKFYIDSLTDKIDPILPVKFAANETVKRRLVLRAELAKECNLFDGILQLKLYLSSRNAIAGPCIGNAANVFDSRFLHQQPPSQNNNDEDLTGNNNNNNSSDTNLEIPLELRELIEDNYNMEILHQVIENLFADLNNTKPTDMQTLSFAKNYLPKVVFSAEPRDGAPYHPFGPLGMHPVLLADHRVLYVTTDRGDPRNLTMSPYNPIFTALVK